MRKQILFLFFVIVLCSFTYAEWVRPIGVSGSSNITPNSFNCSSNNYYPWNISINSNGILSGMCALDDGVDSNVSYQSNASGWIYNGTTIVTNGSPNIGIGTTPNNRFQVLDYIKFDNPNFSTFYGYEAGKNSASPGYNTFMGYGAGKNTVIGQQNIAMGVNALLSNTNGSQNFALGTNALGLNIVGNNNVAIGRTALYANTASYQTAIGDSSLSSNTAGYNTAIGYSTLRVNTGGTFNTAVGASCMDTNTGSRNTGVGYASLFSSTSADYNTAIGMSGGRSITTGDYNTFIGNDAGFHASQNTTAQNSMALGNGAYTTKDDQVVIGNTAVTETILRGNVGIGTTPQTKLDIYSTTTPTAFRIINARATGSNYGFDSEVIGAGTNNYASYFYANGATNNYGLYVEDGGPPLGTNNYAMYLNSPAKSYIKGSLGIGKNPIAKLDVNGSMNIISDSAYRSMLITKGPVGESAITFNDGGTGYATIGLSATTLTFTTGQYIGQNVSAQFLNGLAYFSDSTNLYGTGETNAEITPGSTRPAIHTLSKGVSTSSDIALLVTSGNTYQIQKARINFDGSGFFMNNISIGKTTATAKLDVNGSFNADGNATINLPYINIWNFTDGGYTISISNSSVYYNFSNWILDGNNAFTFNTTTGIIKPLINGSYEVIFGTSINCGINGVYGIGISKNSASPEGTQCYTHFDGEGNHNTRSFNCILSMNTADNLSVVIDDENTPAQNCNVIQQSLTIKRLGS